MGMHGLPRGLRARALARRSEIRSVIKRLLYEDRREYVIMYRHRRDTGGETLRPLKVYMIDRVDSWAIHLKDGFTTIPLHRVVEVRDEEGRVFWRRKGQ